MAKRYVCSECGEYTSSWNEGQCPTCMITDSLYFEIETSYVGEDWEVFNSNECTFNTWDN